jgi:hypothetical protein
VDPTAPAPKMHGSELRGGLQDLGVAAQIGRHACLKSDGEAIAGPVVRDLQREGHLLRPAQVGHVERGLDQG